MKLRPEGDPSRDCQRCGDAPQASDVLVADLTALTSSFDEAELQPAGGLAEADKHRVVAGLSPTLVRAPLRTRTPFGGLCGGVGA